MATIDPSLELNLRQWLVQQGGYVHPDLQLVDTAPCGARGIVAARPVSLSKLEASPLLIVVPQDVHLNNRKAVVLLQAALRASGLAAVNKTHDAASAVAALSELSALQQVALSLAFERRRGRRSPWHAYIACLPELPPPPWARDTAVEQSAAVASVGQGRPETQDWPQAVSEAEVLACALSQGWPQAVSEARNDFQQQAAEAVQLVGRHLGLRDADVFWALGQVVSRSLSDGDSAGLLPYIDLLNHGARARPPMMELDDSDRVVSSVTCIQDGELRAMTAGQELLILYGGGHTPLQAFLKFGFVPGELWSSDL